MSHTHFCDYAGHDWECEGTAVRLSVRDSGPTPCVCVKHGVPMDEGDHSECPIELLACPEHREDQLRQSRKSGMGDLPRNVDSAESGSFADTDGKKSMGFCLWCNQDFYSYDDVEAHNAEDSKACSAYQDFLRAQPHE